MGAGHHHALPPSERRGSERRLVAALALAAIYMVAEIVGGLLSGSLALLADAAHMFSDVAALGLSLFAAWMARRPASARHTYGFHRTEILAALVNGATLLAVSGYILVEAWHRFADPQPVASGLMLAVAVGGLAVNLVGLGLLHGARDHGLNLRAAWLHVVGDALGSVAAILAALAITFFGWTWTDALASVVISAFVLRGALSLLRETVSVLMEGAPGHVDVDRLQEALLEVDGVRAVHDLHVWTITSGLVALSCHVVHDREQDHEGVLGRLQELLREQFEIAHCTIQLEPEGFDVACGTC